MIRGGAIDDLFGHVPQKGELPMAAAGAAGTDGNAGAPNREIRFGFLPTPPGGHTPDSIREQCHYVLDQARAAQTMPWDARMIRRYTAGFLYWVEWLKGGEGDALLNEFKAEMDRLELSPEHVAPNWRERWGIPEWTGAE